MESTHSVCSIKMSFNKQKCTVWQANLQCKMLSWLIITKWVQGKSCCHHFPFSPSVRRYSAIHLNSTKRCLSEKKKKSMCLFLSVSHITKSVASRRAYSTPVHTKGLIKKTPPSQGFLLFFHVLQSVNNRVNKPVNRFYRSLSSASTLHTDTHLNPNDRMLLKQLMSWWICMYN